MTGVQTCALPISVNINTGWQVAPLAGFTFEVKLDAPDGKLLGTATLPVPSKDQKTGLLKIPIQQVTDGKMHDLYFVYKVKGVLTGAGVVSVQFNAK